MNYKDKVKDRDDLKQIIQSLQNEGQKIVQCHGCFDILHPGHIRYLEMAKKQGDILVVSLTADQYIMKGDDRPYMPQELRVNTMAALAFVDYVYLDENSWAGPILDYLRPDIYVKGKEYETIYTGRFGEERKIVETNGGTVFFSSGDVVFSSSQIIEDFKNRFAFDYEVFNVFAKRNNLTFDGYKSLTAKFKGKRVLVIGETILDEYHYCEVVNVSGEAPILTIKPKKVDRFVGGAGIIAKHIKKLGGESTLISFLGQDEPAEYITNDLAKNEVDFLPITLEKIPTIKKVRYIGDTQKLLKIDYSEKALFDNAQEKALWDLLAKNIPSADIIILTDFGYGLITKPVLQNVIDIAEKHGVKIIADTSGTMGGNISKYTNVFLITPTEREIRSSMDDHESGLSVIAHKFLQKTQNQNLLVTLGANGLLIFKNKTFGIKGSNQEHLQSEYLPAFEKKATDPMGAGDAMLSAISLAISAGSSIEQAAYLGSVASYLEVNKNGNIPISIDEVMDFLSNRMELSNG